MKLTLLLIPLILLSSCVINGIAPSTPSPTTQPQEPGIIQANEPFVPDNFGSGFTLSQTDDETILNYSGKVVKVWSHTPPEKVPFIWDEACVIAWEGFVKLSSSELSGTGRQGVWDALTEGEKKACMKETLKRSIIVEAIDNRFFEIRRIFYETGMYWAYDTQTKNLQELPTMGDISVTASESGVLLVIDMAYGSDTIKLLYDTNFSNLISQEKIPK